MVWPKSIVQKLRASLLSRLGILLVFGCYCLQDNLMWQKIQRIRNTSIICSENKEPNEKLPNNEQNVFIFKKASPCHAT